MQKDSQSEPPGSTLLFKVDLPTILPQAYRPMPLWNQVKGVWKFPKGAELNRSRLQPLVPIFNAVSKLTGKKGVSLRTT